MYRVVKFKLVLLASLAWIVAGVSAIAVTLPAQSPLFFESLPAQSETPFRFVSRGQDYLFAVAPGEAQIILQKRIPPAEDALPGRERLAAHSGATVRSLRLKFLGANPAAVVSGDSELPGKINYFIGDDPAKWTCGASMFSKVRVADLYPGISLVYYGNHRQLEYDFELAPGADPRLISLGVEGMDGLRISDEGDLMIRLGEEEVRQLRPEIYQVVNGVRQPIKGQYQLKDASTVEVAVEQYNPVIPLVIDPQLTYSSYFGGNAMDVAYAVKVDANGFVYLTGETLSTRFRFFTNAFNNYSTNFAGGKVNGDAFIAKFDNTLINPPVYFSYLGGSNDDGALDLAIDSTEHAYITGFTASTDFASFLPNIVPGLTNKNPSIFDTIAKAFPTSAFIAEFDTTQTGANSLVFSGYLGGKSGDEGIGIALDESRRIYVTGYTFSTNSFPTTANAFQTICRGSNDVFVAKIGADGAGGVLYSSLLGGTNIDEAQGVAASGDFAFVTGYTGSTNFPVTANALQPWINNATNSATVYKNKAVPLDAFVAVFDTAASTGSASLRYSSYFGGTNNDAGFRITLDASMNAYITGNTTSSNFPDTHPTTPPIRNSVAPTNGPNYDAILAKFGSLTTAPTNIFSFPFGGTLNDVGWDIALDAAGDIFISGVTTSVTNFPSLHAPSGFLRATNMGANDAFVTAFSADATNLLYSVYFGGNLNDFGYGIAADAAGNVYLTGQTWSTNLLSTNMTPTNFPVVGAFQSQINSTNDAFLAVILLDHPPTSATVSPTPQNNAWGSNTTFTVTASGGDAPTSYQWKKNNINLANGTHIAGADSSSITISNITAADSGSYTADVANSAGGITSSAGILTVFTPSPTISSMTVSGGNVIISFTSTNGFDSTSVFTLQSAGAVTGPYTNNPSGSFSGSGGSFQVIVPKGGDTMFYRLKHSN